jgi:hypothetical protein
MKRSGAFSFRRAFVIGCVIVSPWLAACGSKGDKCDTCSSDSDCDQGKGYVCESYADGKSRCGDPTKPGDTCPQ